MPPIPSFVGVREPAEPKWTKRVESVQVLVDGVEVEREVVSLADPEEPEQRVKVTSSTPAPSDGGLVVREAPPNYDSGYFIGTFAEGQVTDETTDVTKVMLSNLTTVQQWVTLKDDPGNVYLNQFPLGSKQFVLLDFGGMTFDSGIRQAVKTDGAVAIQIKGRQ